MTYKQMEASRKARLLTRQVIVPAVVAAIMSNKESRDFVKQKSKDAKAFVTNKFKKKEHFGVVK